MGRRISHIQGFTLIELSIVLVIIGLLVGGVLVGQDLIKAAQVRAQISQIEKFNTAVNTFYGKYGALPGDIQPNLVTQFGFKASPNRSGTTGDGDGNGELDGAYYGSTPYAWNQTGENLYFWEDLSANSNLIEGTFDSDPGPYGDGCGTSAGCSADYPPAKIGNGAFVYVYSGYAANCCVSPYVGFGPDFFGLSVVTDTGNVGAGSAPGLTVSQAYNIDKKIDDGLPTTGNVLAQYLVPATGAPGWSFSAGSSGPTTCYDTSSGTAAYSISYKNGNLVNCGISFQFQ